MIDIVRPMPKIQWDETYSVGVGKFDDQHKVLFGYINELYDSMRNKDNRETVAAIIEKLMNYTMTHFFEEEIELYKNEYPNYEKHKDAHDKLVAQVREFYVRFHAGHISSMRLSIEIIAVLTEWLQKHILSVDRMYGEFLNARNIR